MRKTTRRSGYALMSVLVSLVLLLALWSVTYRLTASALRVETVRAQNLQRDEGSVQALAHTLTLLETGSPPSDPYTCETLITTSSGVRFYTVTITSEGNNHWKLAAAPMLPGVTPRPMPSIFAPTN